MTEAEWLACTNPMRMLEFLGERITCRQRRLFAVACCRRIWTLLTNARSRDAVELAERSVDEPVSEVDLDLASGEAEWAFEDSLTHDNGVPVEEDPRPAAAEAASYASSPGALEIERHLGVVIEATATASADRGDRPLGHLASLIRDIVGNPFQPMAVDPAWLTWNDGTIPNLAQAIYAERAFDRLPILGDALEDAGCDNADILAHLRSEGPHVHGCWALDLLLGKE